MSNALDALPNMKYSLSKSLLFMAGPNILSLLFLRFFSRFPGANFIWRRGKCITGFSFNTCLERVR